jgi:hypothetical protein
MKSRRLASTFLLALLFLGFSSGAIPIKGQPGPYSLNINVSSPIENGIYANNTVPISFTYDTKAIPSSYSVQEVFFSCILDGHPSHELYSEPGSNGTFIRLGDYFAPTPLSCSSSLDVPEGNHTLYVEVTLWGEGRYDIYGKGQYYIYDNSAVINFTVVNSTVLRQLLIHQHQPLPLQLLPFQSFQL